MNLARYIPKDFNDGIIEVFPGIFQKTFILPQINYDFFEDKEKSFSTEILERLPEEIAPAYKIQLSIKKSINPINPSMYFRGDKFDYLRKEFNDSLKAEQLSPYKKEAAITISLKAANIEKAKLLMNVFYNFLDSRMPGVKADINPVIDIFKQATVHPAYFISRGQYGKLLRIKNFPENKELLTDCLKANCEMMLLMNLQKTSVLMASGYAVLFADSLQRLEYQEEVLKRFAKEGNFIVKAPYWNQKKAILDACLLGKDPIWDAEEIGPYQIMNLFSYETNCDFTGIYYGKTINGNESVMSNIKSNRPGVNWIFGTGGAGNSLSVKNEALQVFLTTQDNIVLFSLHKDYRTMTQLFDGQVIDLTQKENKIQDIVNAKNRVLAIEASYIMSQDMPAILTAIRDFVIRNQQHRTWIYLDDLDFVKPSVVTKHLEMLVQQGCPVTCVLKNAEEFLNDETALALIKDSPLVQLNSLDRFGIKTPAMINAFHLTPYEEKFLENLNVQNALLISSGKRIFFKKKFVKLHERKK